MERDMNQKDINDAVDYLYTHGRKYAEAKAQKGYLENYTKSLINSLSIGFLRDGTAKSMSQAEAMAYAHDSYIVHIGGIKEAVELEEALRWGLVSAQARIDVWRSTEASNRVMDKAVQ
jgi:hypothetical protein